MFKPYRHFCWISGQIALISAKQLNTVKKHVQIQISTGTDVIPHHTNEIIKVKYNQFLSLRCPFKNTGVYN